MSTTTASERFVKRENAAFKITIKGNLVILEMILGMTIFLLNTTSRTAAFYALVSTTLAILVLIFVVLILGLRSLSMLKKATSDVSAAYHIEIESETSRRVTFYSSFLPSSEITPLNRKQIQNDVLRDIITYRILSYGLLQLKSDSGPAALARVDVWARLRYWVWGIIIKRSTQVSPVGLSITNEVDALERFIASPPACAISDQLRELLTLRVTRSVSHAGTTM